MRIVCLLSLSLVLPGVNLRSNSFKDGEDNTSIKSTGTCKRFKFQIVHMIEDLLEPCPSEERRRDLNTP